MHMHSSTASSEAKQKAHHDGKDSSREKLELLMKRLTGRTSLASLIFQQLPLQTNWPSDRTLNSLKPKMFVVYLYSGGKVLTCVINKNVT